MHSKSHKPKLLCIDLNLILEWHLKFQREGCAFHYTYLHVVHVEVWMPEKTRQIVY